MKVAGWLLCAVFLLSGSYETFSQMDRRTIKANNRKLMTYRGKKSNFSKEKRYFTIGPSINALNYYGDLAPDPGRLSTDISFTRPAFGITYAHRLGPRYS